MTSLFLFLNISVVFSQEGSMVVFLGSLGWMLLLDLQGTDSVNLGNSCSDISLIPNSSRTTFSFFDNTIYSVLFIIIPSFLKALYDEEDPWGSAEWRPVWMREQKMFWPFKEKTAECRFKAVGKANVMHGNALKSSADKPFTLQYGFKSWKLCICNTSWLICCK